MFRYYLVYLYGEHRYGSEYIRRDTPIDNEDALIEEHARLEQTFRGPVVILSWKRID